MDHIDPFVRNIPRLNTEHHAKLMYGLCRGLGVRKAVEVGAFHGFTTVHIAQAIKENGGGLLTVIDDFTLRNDVATLHNNLVHAGVSDQVQIIAGDSRQVGWPMQVDFAFIDGNHSFEGCKHDVNRAIRCSARCICFHDTTDWWGPKEFMELIREQASGEWDILDLAFDGGLGVMVKKEHRGPVTMTKEKYPSGAV